MVQVVELWLPILLSGVGVFLGSMLAWMVLPHHRRDYGPLPEEERAREVLADVPPGQYNIPNLPSRKSMEEPEFRTKLEEGPLVFLTVAPPGVPRPGPTMARWLLFTIGVAGVVGVVASRGLPAAAPSWRIFQVTAIVTWATHGLGVIQEVIWFGRPWSVAAKQTADGLLYGVITGAIFVWLWPG